MELGSLENQMFLLFLRNYGTPKFKIIPKYPQLFGTLHDGNLREIRPIKGKTLNPEP